MRGIKPSERSSWSKLLYLTNACYNCIAFLQPTQHFCVNVVGRSDVYAYRLDERRGSPRTFQYENCRSRIGYCRIATIRRAFVGKLCCRYGDPECTCRNPQYVFLMIRNYGDISCQVWPQHSVLVCNLNDCIEVGDGGRLRRLLLLP